LFVVDAVSFLVIHPFFLFLFSSQIVYYVLRDLFLEHPNYPVSDLMDKWAGRLPLGDCYERCVSMEWLQERKFVPHQLCFDHHDDNVEQGRARAGGINHHRPQHGMVVRLAPSHTVLVFEKNP
jgi:hypothetical protein